MNHTSWPDAYTSDDHFVCDRLPVPENNRICPSVATQLLNCRHFDETGRRAHVARFWRRMAFFRCVEMSPLALASGHDNPMQKTIEIVKAL